MVANDISLWKLQNPEFECFFKKYNKLKSSDDDLLKIRKEVGNCSIWVLIS